MLILHLAKMKFIFITKNHVEDGNLFVGEDVKEQVLVDVSYANIYTEIELPTAANKKTKCTMSQLPQVDLIIFDIDEKVIQTHDIKFRLLLPLAVLELSEIEYKGKIYKGVRDSSLINNMQSK